MLHVAPSDQGVASVVIDAPPMNLIGPDLVRELVALLSELDRRCRRPTARGGLCRLPGGPTDAEQAKPSEVEAVRILADSGRRRNLIEAVANTSQAEGACIHHERCSERFSALFRRPLDHLRYDDDSLTDDGLQTRSDGHAEKDADTRQHCP
jgi:hypothetical protein